MTAILYGTDNCPACEEAKTLLGRTPLDWRYVDTKKSFYKGDLPALQFETGHWLVGLAAITQYIKKQGFP